MRASALAVLAVALAPAWPAPSVVPLAAEKTPPFTLAVMRRDGIMIPFASRSGSTWTVRWPTPLAEVDIPISLASIPRAWWGKEGPGAAWTLWRPEAPPAPVRPLQPVVFDSHCVLGIGLKTDYRSPEPAPPRMLHHHPKDGLAVTGPMAIEPIRTLTVRDIEWVTAMPIIAGAIREARRNRQRVSVDPALWETGGNVLYALTASSVASSRDWDTATMTLEVLCRSMGPNGKSPVYYFEAAQTLETTIVPRVGVTVVELSQGFIFENGGAVASILATTTARSAAEFAIPLGAVRTGSDLFWVVQWSGTGRERYAVMRIGRREATFVVNAPGGGC